MFAFGLNSTLFRLRYSALNGSHAKLVRSSSIQDRVTKRSSVQTDNWTYEIGRNPNARAPKCRHVGSKPPGQSCKATSGTHKQKVSVYVFMRRPHNTTKLQAKTCCRTACQDNWIAMFCAKASFLCPDPLSYIGYIIASTLRSSTLLMLEVYSKTLYIGDIRMTRMPRFIRKRLGANLQVHMNIWLVRQVRGWLAGGWLAGWMAAWMPRLAGWLAARRCFATSQLRQPCKPPTDGEIPSVYGRDAWAKMATDMTTVYQKRIRVSISKLKWSAAHVEPGFPAAKGCLFFNY